MDFIEKLYRSDTEDTTLVIVDKFTKYCNFIAFSQPFATQKIPRIFLDQVYRLHGMLKVLALDKEKVFTSLFWQELMRLIGTDLHLITAYHSQSNGQMKRMNECLDGYFGCMTFQKPHL